MYYVLITSPEDFEIDVKNRFSVIGLSEPYRGRVQKFQVGDKIVFYVRSKSVFGGIAEVTGPYYYSREKIWSDPYDLWPHRVKAKALYIIKDPERRIYVKEIWEGLGFIKNKGPKWGTHFLGCLKNLPEDDYKVIESEIKKRT